jgi:hypothetical protein
MFLGATKTRVVVTAAIAAMWLTACGGGGGDDVAAAPSPAPAPAAGGGGNPPAPAPSAPLGTSFTAAAPADVWHSLSSSTDGQVMVAGQADLRATDTSPLFVSRDGGVTFTESTAPSGIWIASDVSGDGNRIAAVQFQGGGVFMSVDRGQTFVPVALPAGVAASSQFEGVTLSEDGTRIAAVIMGGPVIVGTVAADGSVTWITPTGLPLTASSWRSIDSSANGQVMVAVGQTPVAFISTDGGATWASLAAAPVTQNWYRVKVSADGQTIAMAGNSFGGSNSADGIYVSKDQGATFTRAGAAGDYSAIAMSADGGVIAATVSDDNTGAGIGSVQLSADGGTTFAPVPVTVGGVAAADTNWRAVTMSGDASRMAVAAGRFDTNGTGQVYLTTGSRP